MLKISVLTLLLSATFSMALAQEAVTLPTTTTPTATLSTDQPGFPYPTLVKLPGIGQTDANGRNVVMINPESVGLLLKSFFNYLIGIALVLTVVMVVYGGVIYATSDAASKTANGKKIITDAFYGLALVLSSWLILYTINPDLLNFTVDIGRVELQESTEGGLGVLVDTTGAGSGGGFGGYSDGLTAVGTAGRLGLPTSGEGLRLLNMARQTATSNGLDPAVFACQIAKESSYNPNASRYESHLRVSSYGLGQILTTTARESCNITSIPALRDPQTNLNCAARIMRSNLATYNGYTNALAAYNGGGGALQTRSRGGRTCNGQALWRCNSGTSVYVPTILACARANGSSAN